MMKKGFIGIFLILMFVSSLSFVIAEPTLYEYYTENNDYTQITQNGQWGAQTFTIGSVGTNSDFIPEKISLLLYNAVGGEDLFTVGIKQVNSSGAPVGEYIMSDSVSETLLPSSGPEWYNFSMDTSVELNASFTYAIVATTDGSSLIRWYDDLTGNYSGGSFFVSANGSDETWLNYNLRDFDFMIWGEEDSNETSTWTEGLVHYYKLDETSGTQALDSVQDQGTNLSLEFFGSPEWVTEGKIGGGLNVSAGNWLRGNITNMSLTGNYSSIGMWVFETDTTGSDQGIWGTGSQTSPTNIFSKQVNGGYWWTLGTRTKTANIYEPGHWVFLVMTTNATGHYIFVNGSMDISVEFSSANTFQTWDNFTVGRNVDYYMTGTIDEIAFWNRTLTPSEINTLWNNGDGITYPTSSQNETSTNQSGFWNLNGTYLYPSSLDYFVGIGTATPRVALDVIGTIFVGDGSLRLGTQDAYGRYQIWNFLPASVLRLGSLSADGDAQTIASQGIVVYGNNSRDDAMSSSNYGWARIKPNRIALHNGINGTQSDYFRMDPNGLYLKDDSHVKTFEIVRESGLVNTEAGYSVNSQTGITNNTGFWMCKDSACSTTCQADIKGGIIVGCT